MFFTPLVKNMANSNPEFSVDIGFERRNRLLRPIGVKHFLRVFRNKNEKVSKNYETSRTVIKFLLKIGSQTGITCRTVGWHTLIADWEKIIENPS